MKLKLKQQGAAAAGGGGGLVQSVIVMAECHHHDAEIMVGMMKKKIPLERLKKTSGIASVKLVKILLLKKKRELRLVVWVNHSLLLSQKKEWSLQHLARQNQR